jgi:hypothetical protein
VAEHAGAGRGRGGCRGAAEPVAARVEAAPGKSRLWEGVTNLSI